MQKLEKIVPGQQRMRVHNNDLNHYVLIGVVGDVGLVEGSIPNGFIVCIYLMGTFSRHT